jgi:radical SAM superfamily enzyme YgiQ (UPF0313 family)
MQITLIHPFHYFGLNRFAHRLMPLQGITLAYLARLIPPGHDVRLVYEARERIDYAVPMDVVAITTLTVTAKRAYRIADRFRRRGVKVILGGPHVSALPDEAKQHADAVAVGNGEATLPRIIADIEQGRLQPFYYNFVPERLPALDNIAAPNRWCTSLMASRGCEMNCEFCSMQSIFGKFYLQRCLDEVIQEIRQVNSPNMFFVDDNFFGTSRKTRTYYTEILKAVAATGKHWYGQCRLPIVEDDHTLEFCIASKMELALFTILTPFPGTALFERLDREGRILTKNWNDYTMEKCVFQPRYFTPEELTAALNRAEKEFFSLRSIYRRSQFGMQYNTLEKFLAVNVLRNIGLKFTGLQAMTR